MKHCGYSHCKIILFLDLLIIHKHQVLSFTTKINTRHHLFSPSSTIPFLSNSKIIEQQEEYKTENEKFYKEKFSFPLDTWQIQAGDEIYGSNNVIVCAPTGSGKTVVGEIALHLAYDNNEKAIYTTP